MTPTRLASLLVLTLSCACAPSPLAVTAYGEELVEDGIPADVFADGWRVHFTRFDTRFSDLALVNEAGEEVAADDDAQVIDLSVASAGAGHPLAELSPTGAWDRLRVRLAPAGEEPALFVEGSAERGEIKKTFSWSFETAVTYLCLPLAATDASRDEAQVTVHADHLFYDDLDAEEPDVAFELIAAADRDDDGEVTREELRATNITGAARYQVGSRDITDLWRFVEAQALTVGHIDGEGHCDRAP